MDSICVYCGSSVGIMGTLAALLDAFTSYEPPQVEKWIDRDET